jgi:hypothetical protein
MWAEEQALLGLARDTPPATFAAGGLGALAVPPTVRIVVLPGEPSSIALPAQDPSGVIPPFISLPGGAQLPRTGTVRGVSSGYVGYPERDRGERWPRFTALPWHGGVDFYLGESGGQDRDEAHGMPRLIWLRRTVGWAWGAFGFQLKVIRRYGIEGPFRAIIGVADTASAGLGDLGTGWAEPGGPGSPSAPAAVDHQVLLHEDLAQWPDADGIKELALRFGARLDLAFGGSGDRHLDRTGPEADHFRPPQF